MNIQERLTAFAMLGAGWVMWLLVFLSIVVLAIVLERAYYLLSSRDDFTALKRDFMRLIGKNDLEGARARLRESKSLEARIVSAGLTADNAGAAESRMAAETQNARMHLERNLAFIGTVANNAPFVGLLGTVIGIIRSFRALDSSGGQITEGLMTEIGETLVATAIGILVALPAVAFFNFFNRVIRTRLARADSLGHELIAVLRSNQREPREAEAAE